MPKNQDSDLGAIPIHCPIPTRVERYGDFYAFEASATFAKWRGLLSPDKYEIVDVRTSQGVRRAMLFPKAILRAEAALDAPLRKALGLKRASKHKPSTV
jgi:hypothetical protein